MNNNNNNNSKISVFVHLWYRHCGEERSISKVTVTHLNVKYNATWFNCLIFSPRFGQVSVVCLAVDRFAVLSCWAHSWPHSSAALVPRTGPCLRSWKKQNKHVSFWTESWILALLYVVATKLIYHIKGKAKQFFFPTEIQKVLDLSLCGRL